jgi:hypothetical protein
MDSRRRLRAEELVRRPEFEHLIRKTIQTMCAALPKRLNVPRVRSDKQLAKRRTETPTPVLRSCLRPSRI